MNRIAYYKGCSLEALAVEYDRSTTALCRALGVELVEPRDWNCCGSSPAHSLNPLLSAALSGRNMALAESEGCDRVMTPCPGCLKALKGANEAYEDPGMREDFLQVLGGPYSGRVKPVSLLEFLYSDIGVDAIRQAVVKPLEGLTLAPYYGCLLTRPARVGFDDPENPVSMDRLLEAAGATVPDFPHKTECCGATHGVTRNEIVGRLGGKILDAAVRVGADAVVVACPLCQQNLDLRQAQLDRRWKRSFELPVIYISQALGLALGLSPKSLGMDKLIVNADSLLPVNRAHAAQGRQAESREH